MHESKKGASMMRSLDSSEPNTLSGKVVVVTGAGRGIGSHIAQRFSLVGASVAINCNNSLAEAEQGAAKIKEGGGQAVAIQADVTLPKDVDRMFQQVMGHFGQIDILVNNAGLYPVCDLLDLAPEEWDLVLRTNLNSVFLCTQQAARYMLKQGDGGSIINITSIEAESPAPGHSHYSVSKAGVNMLTKASALELGQFGIRVNAIAPGLIWRDGIEESWPDGVSRWKKAVPLKRFGHGLDVANACLFFASHFSEWITGTILTVDGGVLVNQTY